MPLTFPTLAETTLSAWKEHPKTISLVTFAIRHGAERLDERTFDNPSAIRLVFDDDTSLLITGRGRSQQVSVELP